MDKLSKYRVDKGYTEGVHLTLDNAPDVDFLVKLPGPHNRAYMAEVYGRINIDMSSDEVELSLSALDAKTIQEESFVKHCIMSIDGEPAPEDFLEQYPDAVSELMSKAQAIVNKLMGVVEDGVKKLVPISTGNNAGATG